MTTVLTELPTRYVFRPGQRLPPTGPPTDRALHALAPAYTGCWRPQNDPAPAGTHACTCPGSCGLDDNLPEDL